jgi:hypothetical protein
LKSLVLSWGSPCKSSPDIDKDGRLTINVPVVYMARDVMILMRAASISRPMKRVGPENGDFLGPERSEFNLDPEVEV